MTPDQKLRAENIKLKLVNNNLETQLLQNKLRNAAIDLQREAKAFVDELKLDETQDFDWMKLEVKKKEVELSKVKSKMKARK